MDTVKGKVPASMASANGEILRATVASDVDSFITKMNQEKKALEASQKTYEGNEKKVKDYATKVEGLRTAVDAYNKKKTPEGRAAIAAAAEGLPEPTAVFEEVFGENMHADEGKHVSKIYDKLYDDVLDKAKGDYNDLQSDIEETLREDAEALVKEALEGIEASEKDIITAKRKEYYNLIDSAKTKEEIDQLKTVEEDYLRANIGIKQILGNLIEQFGDQLKHETKQAITDKVPEIQQRISYVESKRAQRQSQEAMADTDLSKYIIVLDYEVGAQGGDRRIFQYTPAYHKLSPDQQANIRARARYVTEKEIASAKKKTDRSELAVMKLKGDAKLRERLGEKAKQYFAALDHMAKGDLDKARKAFTDYLAAAKGFTPEEQEKQRLTIADAMEKLAVLSMKGTEKYYEGLNHLKNNDVKLAVASLNAYVAFASKLKPEQREMHAQNIEQAKEVLKQIALKQVNLLDNVFDDVKKLAYAKGKEVGRPTLKVKEGEEADMLLAEITQLRSDINSGKVTDFDREFTRIKLKLQKLNAEQEQSQGDSLYKKVDELYAAIQSKDPKVKERALTAFADEARSHRAYSMARKYLDYVLADAYEDVSKHLKREDVLRDMLEDPKAKEFIAKQTEAYMANLRKTNPDLARQLGINGVEQIVIKQKLDDQYKMALRKKMKEFPQYAESDAYENYNEWFPLEHSTWWNPRTYGAEEWDDFQDECIQFVFESVIMLPVGMGAGAVGKLVGKFGGKAGTKLAQGLARKLGQKGLSKASQEAILKYGVAAIRPGTAAFKKLPAALQAELKSVGRLALAGRAGGTAGRVVTGLAAEGATLFTLSQVLEGLQTGQTPSGFAALSRGDFSQLGVSVLQAGAYRLVGGAGAKMFGKGLASKGLRYGAAVTGMETASGVLGTGVEVGFMYLQGHEDQVTSQFLVRAFLQNVMTGYGTHIGHGVSRLPRLRESSSTRRFKRAVEASEAQWKRENLYRSRVAEADADIPQKYRANKEKHPGWINKEGQIVFNSHYRGFKGKNWRLGRRNGKNVVLVDGKPMSVPEFARSNRAEGKKLLKEMRRVKTHEGTHRVLELFEKTTDGKLGKAMAEALVRSENSLLHAKFAEAMLAMGRDPELTFRNMQEFVCGVTDGSVKLTHGEARVLEGVIQKAGGLEGFTFARAGKLMARVDTISVLDPKFTREYFRRTNVDAMTVEASPLIKRSVLADPAHVNAYLAHLEAAAMYSARNRQIPDNPAGLDARTFRHVQNFDYVKGIESRIAGKRTDINKISTERNQLLRQIPDTLADGSLNPTKKTLSDINESLQAGVQRDLQRGDYRAAIGRVRKLRQMIAGDPAMKGAELIFKSYEAEIRAHREISILEATFHVDESGLRALDYENPQVREKVARALIERTGLTKEKIAAYIKQMGPAEYKLLVHLSRQKPPFGLQAVLAGRLKKYPDGRIYYEGTAPEYRPFIYDPMKGTIRESQTLHKARENAPGLTPEALARLTSLEGTPPHILALLADPAATSHLTPEQINHLILDPKGDVRRILEYHGDHLNTDQLVKIASEKVGENTLLLLKADRKRVLSKEQIWYLMENPNNHFESLPIEALQQVVNGKVDSRVLNILVQDSRFFTPEMARELIASHEKFFEDFGHGEERLAILEANIRRKILDEALFEIITTHEIQTAVAADGREAKYFVTRQLGEGGVNTVHHAYAYVPESGYKIIEVAAKKPKAELGGDLGSLAGFAEKTATERLVGSEINGERTVRHFFVAEDGTIFMETMPGADVAGQHFFGLDEIDTMDTSSLPPKEKARVAKLYHRLHLKYNADTLAVHREGIGVDFDSKPGQGILEVGPDGQVNVRRGDFGSLIQKSDLKRLKFAAENTFGFADADGHYYYGQGLLLPTGQRRIVVEDASFTDPSREIRKSIYQATRVEGQPTIADAIGKEVATHAQIGFTPGTHNELILRQVIAGTQPPDAILKHSFANSLYETATGKRKVLKAVNDPATGKLTHKKPPEMVDLAVGAETHTLPEPQNTMMIQLAERLLKLSDTTPMSRALAEYERIIDSLPGE
ncbi:hypothetical protein ACFL2V_04370 [Pseudomonadota bacterium]